MLQGFHSTKRTHTQKILNRLASGEVLRIFFFPTKLLKQMERREGYLGGIKGAVSCCGHNETTNFTYKCQWTIAT